MGLSPEQMSKVFCDCFHVINAATPEGRREARCDPTHHPGPTQTPHRFTHPIIFLTKASFCSSVTWTCRVRLLELTPRTALVSHACASCRRWGMHQTHLLMARTGAGRYTSVPIYRSIIVQPVWNYTYDGIGCIVPSCAVSFMLPKMLLANSI